MCSAHYKQFVAHGTTWPIGSKKHPGPAPVPIEKRFWTHVDKRADGCWAWTGDKNAHRGGYGMVHVGTVNGKHLPRKLAHRVAWEMTNGPIPDGLSVLHKCDNPPCINPDHLFLGTHADNMLDMANKDRTLFGERRPQAKLTEAQVVEIRRRLAAGEGQAALGREFGVTNGAIKEIKFRRNWRRVA